MARALVRRPQYASEIRALLDALPQSEAGWLLTRRPEQCWPEGEWRTLLLRAGRGGGKTRTGAELTIEAHRRRGYRRSALVARTAADVRDVMIGGPSGILACAPPSYRPTWQPSLRRLMWPDGSITTTYSADEPDQLRGPQHDWAWGDEVATWDRDVWDQLSLGLRVPCPLGPRVVLTTTPRPLRWLQDLEREPGTVVRVWSTRANAGHLDAAYLARVQARYGGTALGRQELEGELLTEAPGALWTRARIDAARVPGPAPTLQRIVVAIDPAVTAREGSDETGIVAAGIDRERRLWVLADRSGRLSPDAWARRAVDLYRELRADRIVAEQNQGGEMVEATVRQVSRDVPYRAVWASRGKIVRSEPVAALYEQGRARHLPGLGDLEDQLCGWAPGEASPDRLDALVWAATDLLGDDTGAPIGPSGGDTDRDLGALGR